MIYDLGSVPSVLPNLVVPLIGVRGGTKKLYRTHVFSYLIISSNPILDLTTIHL